MLDRQSVEIHRVPKYLWAPSKGKEREEVPAAANPPASSQIRPKPTRKAPVQLPVEEEEDTRDVDMEDAEFPSPLPLKVGKPYRKNRVEVVVSPRTVGPKTVRPTEGSSKRDLQDSPTRVDNVAKKSRISVKKPVQYRFGHLEVFEDQPIDVEHLPEVEDQVRTTVLSSVGALLTTS